MAITAPVTAVAYTRRANQCPAARWMTPPLRTEAETQKTVVAPSAHVKCTRRSALNRLSINPTRLCRGGPAEQAERAPDEQRHQREREQRRQYGRDERNHK